MNSEPITPLAALSQAGIVRLVGAYNRQRSDQCRWVTMTAACPPAVSVSAGKICTRHSVGFVVQEIVDQLSARPFGVAPER